MSNEFKGTPGPWAVDGHNLTAVIGDIKESPSTGMLYQVTHVCNCNYGYADPDKHFELNMANATLIAAAPELLASLIDLDNRCRAEDEEYNMPHVTAAINKALNK